jgi:group I intron endonuclease
MKKIGIYKITSPSKKIYIGQSVDIYRRWLEHKRISEKYNTKLKNSLLKYGTETHIFEIIEECDVAILNDREAYWQDYYNSINLGLNCFRTSSTDRTGYLCEESRKKISESRKANPDVNAKRKGIPLTEEHKRKIGLGNKGKIKSEETRAKISNNRKGKTLGENHHNYGKSINEKSREAFSRINKTKTGLLNKASKDVIDTATGIFYYSIIEALEYNDRLNYKKLVGEVTNDTFLCIAQDYEQNKVKKYIPKHNPRNTRKITDGDHIYQSITEYSKLKNMTRDKIYTKLKNKELNYV